VLKLGTEIVAAQDGSIAGLLGASPGASTAAPIMLSVLQKVFKDKVASPEWQAKLHQIVPSYGTQLNSDPAKVAAEWAYTAKILELPTPPVIGQVAAPAAPAAEKAEAPKENAARDMAL
jgi:malate dehydrogenase (quinone)